MKFVTPPLKKYIFFLLSLIALCGTQQLAAQQKPPVIDIAKILLHDTIYYRSACFQDSLHTITADQLAQLSFTNIPKNVFRHISTGQAEKDWWLCFRLKNSADSLIKVYFFPGVYADKIDIYEYKDSLNKPLLIPLSMPETPDSIGYRGIAVPAGHQALYYVHVKFVRTSVNAMDIHIIRDYYVLNFSKSLKIPLNNGNMYTYIISGILLMMIFYSMAVFILNGSIEFMYYACFALFTGLLFFLKSFYTKSTVSFNYFFESYLDFVIQSLGVFFYYIFLRKFLETKKSFPFLNKLFTAGQVIIGISLSFFSYCYFFTNKYAAQETIESWTKYLWLTTTVLFIVYALLRKNKMLNFLAAGHFFLLALSILSIVLINNPNIFPIPKPSVWRDSIFYYELGMTVELIFFLMALAFKNRHDIIDRTRERERLLLDNERKEFEKQLAVVEAKQEERDRISTDMHDELGSGVTAIRLMSEIVKTKMKGNTLPEIDKISNNANDLLSKMNTIIWTMSSSNDRLDNMIAYTRSYALEFFENTNINCHFETAENIPSTEMSGEKRRNVFLCVKESLNNIVKHSKANDVWIKVTVLPGTLDIQIHDNGIGINFQKLREFGNGLNNMKKRIESIDGNFSIINKEGTTTTLIVPM
ncbi:MAG TPA: 7TM diverse intracellular signaling domain-containing protein [Chitinophagaceae bacterium]|nr:7TM diverse intracellular signaling domain-containing protein [Chitinophagaceae bacterium]